MKSGEFYLALTSLRCLLGIQSTVKWAAAMTGWNSEGRGSEAHKSVTLQPGRDGVETT